MSDYAVVLGSLNLDVVIRGPRMPAKGESVLGASFNTYPGGKGANQAVQLARLGIETYMIGRVGDDAYADQVLQSLIDAGVKTEHVIRDPASQTGIGCVFVDDAADNYIIVIPQANMNWNADELTGSGDLIRGAGLLLCQLETPVSIVDRAIRVAKAAGVATVLNTAPAADLPRDLFPHIDLLIANESESAHYLGQSAIDAAGALDSAHKLQKMGSGAVAITLGERGAMAVDQSQELQCPAFAVDAVDVTAAGDSFCGGLAYARLRSLALDEGLRLACACGALAATKAGAQPSLPTLSEVRSFMTSTGG